MDTYSFIANSLEGEVDLNRLANLLKVGKKFSWEEPLIVKADSLEPFRGDSFAEKRVYIYYFGAVVFFNCKEHDINRFYAAIANFADNVHTPKGNVFEEKYVIGINDSSGMTVTNNLASLPGAKTAYVDIIAYTLAKSVALEQIEAVLEVVFDRMEEIIARLDRGELAVPDKQLAKTASSILNFKYRSISHVMILDKPDITWEVEEADRLYSSMANLYELQQRYSQIRHKADTLLDINTVFTALSHARRSARLEWIIIVLIAIEIVLFLMEMLSQ